MRFTRSKRIALELLGPPALGSLLYSFCFGCFAVWEALTQHKDLWDALRERGVFTLVLLIFAYALVGVQSFFYMMIIEWRFARGLNPESWSAVMLSTVLGTASGAALVIFMGKGTTWRLEPTLFWCGFGLIVGFLMGLLVRHWSTGRKLQEIFRG